MKSLSLSALGRDIARAARTNRYEFTDTGLIHISSAKAFIGGVFGCRYAPPGEDFGPAVVGANKFVKEGRTYVMNLIAGHAAPLPLFIAPWSGNVAVADDWKAETFKDVATEFMDYTASSRLPWGTDPVTQPSINNAGKLAQATLTLKAGGPYTIRGFSMLTADGKGATTGLQLVGSRLGADMTGLQGGGKLSVEYTLSALDEDA